MLAAQLDIFFQEFGRRCPKIPFNQEQVSYESKGSQRG